MKINKKIIFSIIISIFAVSALTAFVCIKNNELILQGEVDTKTVDLASKITGRVKEIYVKEGDIVKACEPLILLDTPDIEAKYNQAAAQLELAKKEYARLKDLSSDGAVSVQKFDEINAGMKRTQNLQKEMKSYLDENVIKSPISGQITNILVEKGELVSAGYTIISIVDNNDNWIVLNLREDLVSKIKIGTEFDVKIPALDNKPKRVKVYYISAMGNYTTWRATKIRGDFDLKTFEVRARPIQPIDGMIAGMSAIVDWNKVKK